MRRHAVSPLLLLLVSLFASLLAPAARALEIKAQGRTIRATQDGALKWEHAVVPWTRPARIDGPVRVAESVFYCAEGTLYQTGAVDGVVKKRFELPGHCRGLKPRDTKTVVVTTGAEGSTSWTRTYEIGTDELGQSVGEVPFFQGWFGSWLAREQARSYVDAQVLPTRRRCHDELREKAWTSALGRSKLESTLSELQARARQDPTNPWFAFQRGKLLSWVGRTNEARSAFAEVLRQDEANDYELLAMVPTLDKVALELGERAFRRGMKFMLLSGFEPELNLGTSVPFRLYGLHPNDISPAQLNDLERFAERALDFAPRRRGAAQFFHALADVQERAGDTAAAETSRRRRDVARPYRDYDSASPRAAWSKELLTLFAACLIGFLLTALVRFVRTISGRFDHAEASHTARFNPLARWTRGELVGLILVASLLVFLADYLQRGVAISRVAFEAVVAGADLGNFGHPESVAFWSRAKGEGGGDFLRALALQKAGQLERAAAIYVRLATPKAKNNLGVIRHAQGNGRQARRLWEAALAANPELVESAHNLGKVGISSRRVERAKRFRLSQPLLAMPTQQMWSEAWQSIAKEPPSLIRSVFNAELAVENEVTAHQSRTTSSHSAFGWLLHLEFAILLLASIALIRPLAPQPGPPKVRLFGLLGWILGLVVPGSARQYSVLGPLITVLFVTSLLGTSVIALTGVETTALRSLNDVVPYGQIMSIWDFVPSPEGAFFVALARGWWVLLAANVIAVAVMEHFWPDPVGLVAYVRARRAARSAVSTKQISTTE